VLPIDLIYQCLQHDRVAQKQLYHAMYDYLNSVTSRYTDDQDEAKDILQNTFIRIFRSLEKFDQNLGKFKSWCCKICINEALNSKRSKMKLVFMDTLPEEGTILDNNSIHQSMTLDEIKIIISKMPVAEKTVLMMYFYDELSHKEISELLGIKESSSRSKLARAKNDLLIQWNLING
jgi:RNA polymerase sigma factor (sigma-70 family)